MRRLWAIGIYIHLFVFVYKQLTSTSNLQSRSHLTLIQCIILRYRGEFGSEPFVKMCDEFQIKTFEL